MFAPLAYIGPQEIIIIAIVVLVLFGGSRIPQFAKGFGEGIREFKRSLNGEEATATSGEGSTKKDSEEK
jgi:sec-independent protein translocase protein TatA